MISVSHSVVSDSLWLHGLQPTRLLHPWDYPGKNTGVGCHFLLQYVKVKSESKVTQSCQTLNDPIWPQPTRLLHPWDYLGKSTGVGCHCLLRNIGYSYGKIQSLIRTLIHAENQSEMGHRPTDGNKNNEMSKIKHTNVTLWPWRAKIVLETF